MANAVVLAGGVVSTGGITALALKVFGIRRRASGENEIIEISTSETERRNDDGYGD
jgi:hypothetical protein